MLKWRVVIAFTADRPPAPLTRPGEWIKVPRANPGRPAVPRNTRSTARARALAVALPCTWGSAMAALVLYCIDRKSVSRYSGLVWY